MKKSMDILKNLLLCDITTEKSARIINIDKAGENSEYLDIFVQNSEMKKEGVVVRHRILSEEFEWPLK